MKAKKLKNCTLILAIANYQIIWMLHPVQKFFVLKNVSIGRVKSRNVEEEAEAGSGSGGSG